MAWDVKRSLASLEAAFSPKRRARLFLTRKALDPETSKPGTGFSWQLDVLDDDLRSRKVWPESQPEMSTKDCALLPYIYERQGCPWPRSGNFGRIAPLFLTYTTNDKVVLCHDPEIVLIPEHDRQHWPGVRKSRDRPLIEWLWRRWRSSTNKLHYEGVKKKRE